jgi:phosphoglycolate phosphatase
MDAAHRLQTLVFDLDGTLTDPYVGISRSFLHALKAIGRAPIGEAEMRGFVGPPMQSVFAALCGDDPGLIPAAISAYRERYSRVGLFENVVYPGIPAALTRLARSYELFVCTSKPTTFAKRILNRFDLAHHFAGIYGSELDGTRSDKRVLLQWLLQHERLVGRGAAMIGDRKFDMEAARANELTPVAALWGYGSEDELRAAGAAAYVGEPADLPAFFEIEARQ